MIEKNTKEINVIKGRSGFLWIGDPHIWSKKPGRRKDEDFLSTILGKIAEITIIANDLNLQPIILGDLFHKADDYEPHFLIKVVNSLKSFKYKPITLIGNHEKAEWVLTNQDAVALLKETNVLDTIETNQIYGIFEIIKNGETKKIALGGTPYGMNIPNNITDILENRDIPDKPRTSIKNNIIVQQAEEVGTTKETKEHKIEKKKIGVDHIVWITHDDLAFENMYPGAIAVPSIVGVDILINGHIHGNKKPMLVGNTACYNFGNITRLSVDLKDHIPSVWSWDPFIKDTMADYQGKPIVKMQQHKLSHQTGDIIFNLEGRHSKAKLLIPSTEDGSQFVAMLKQDFSGNKTADGIFISEMIEQYFKDHENISESVKILIKNLFQQSLTKQ